jgi:putative transposase
LLAARTGARQQVQSFIQQLLEEEVAAPLGRQKSQRRETVSPAETGPASNEEPSAAPVYRNGYGKPWHLALPNGTITLRRPRVWGLEARFESRILPLFKRRTEAVGKLLPELYLHGLGRPLGTVTSTSRFGASSGRAPRCRRARSNG